MRQTSFSFIKDYKKEFGGTLLLGKRKTKRPLSSKKPIHLILKSTHKGIFNPGNRNLENLIRSECEKFHIKVYDFALNWSHVHLLIRIYDRQDYVKFIRSITSIMAARIRKLHTVIRSKNQDSELHQLNSNLQQSKTEIDKIFSLRPFTRIIEWGRDLKNALSYQILNQLEGLGLINRKKLRKKSKNCRPRNKLN